MQHISGPLRENLVYDQTQEVCDKKVEEISMLVLQPSYNKEMVNRVQKMQHETHQIIDNAYRRDPTGDCKYQQLHKNIDGKFQQILDEQEYRECERLSKETLQLMRDYMSCRPIDLDTVRNLHQTLGNMWQNASERVSPQSKPRFVYFTTHFCTLATGILHDAVVANAHMPITHGSGLEENLANLSLHSFHGY